MAGFSLSLVYFARYYERRQHAARLQVQLADARFQALKMQVRPHFLFNTLNAIVTLIRKGESSQADQMLTRLGGLLGRALEDSDRAVVPLREEMDFIRGYLDLEKLRFEDSLTIEMDIPEHVLNLNVPSFILQPLVENALRHGVAAHESPGHIVIAATSEENTLILSVDDNGPGFPPGFTLAEAGIGLTNCDQRLKQLYGDSATMSIQKAPGGGSRVRLRIPSHTSGQIQNGGSIHA